ncbi:MAG TPA: ATP synthase F1 subunit delta [Vicinamibacterales bacterium]|jgi:F-type H+-transporting ATPase subunit delta
MTSRGAAVRYARALFDTALAEKRDLQRTYDDLRGFADLFSQNDGLARVMTNPAIPAPRKRAVVETLVRRAGAIEPAVGKLLLLLAERDRLALVPDVAHAFESRLMDHQHVVRAEVVTALPLATDRVAALRDGLKRATGREVRLESRVDPDIIGGAIARIGSTVFDGSVTRQLQRMKETLTSATD